MTTEQKQSIQAVAARYEEHGVSFITLLRLLSGTGADFSKSLTAARYTLGKLYGVREELTDTELSDLDREKVKRYALELESEKRWRQ